MEGLLSMGPNPSSFRRWQVCFKYMKLLKFHDSPQIPVYDSSHRFVLDLIHNNPYKLLREMYPGRPCTNVISYVFYLNTCRTLREKEKLFPEERVLLHRTLVYSSNIYLCQKICTYVQFHQNFEYPFIDNAKSD